MMLKIIKEFSIGPYKVLSVDGVLPLSGYRKYVIDGKNYSIVPLYDIPNSIAIESNDSFIGKTVEFQ